MAMMDTLGLMDKTLYDIGVSSNDLLDVWDSDLNPVGQMKKYFFSTPPL